jgi:anti-sigma factor RsiW
MNNMTSCLHVRQSLGVYVVGAIDPAERTMVDLHLAGCPDCREELAGLAGLPALLGRVPVAEAAQIAGFPPERTGPSLPPHAGPAEEEILTPLLARVAQRRRASRWRNLAAAAAVALIAAGGAAGATQIAQGSGHSVVAAVTTHRRRRRGRT